MKKVLFKELIDCLELDSETKLNAENICNSFLDCEVQKFSTHKVEKNTDVMFVLKYEEFIQNPEEIISDIKLIIASKPINESTIIVKDLKKVLLRFAEYLIHCNNIKTVSVTGSIGKTTTKEIVYSVLSQYKPTVKNAGSANGTTGFFRAVSTINNDTYFLIQEMRLNSPTNFFSDISKAIRPCISIFTNIGTPHIENFESKEHILEYKYKCADYMPIDTGTLIINADDPVLMDKKYNHKVITYGINNTADYYATNIKLSNDCVTFDVLYYGNYFLDAKLNVPGIHNVYGALTAIATGTILGIPKETIKQGLLNFKTSGIRQNVFNGFKNNTIIFDCFGAAPESDIVAFNMLDSINSTGRKIAVLGHMMRLGRFSEKYHTEVGRELAKFGFDEVITFSGRSDLFYEEVKKIGGKAYHFYDRNEFIKFTKSEIKPCDTILFKGINKFCDFDVLVNKIIDKSYVVKSPRYFGKKFSNNKLHCDAKSMALVDLENYDLICGKNIHDRAICGSICTLITCFSLLDTIKANEKIAITEQAISFSKGYSNAELKVGQQYMAYDLLWLAIKKSASDALFQLVIYYYPNMKFFWNKVSNLLRSIGMAHTHLHDPYGKATEDNYSSAFDIALFLRELYKSQTFMEICKTRDREIMDYSSGEKFT